MGAQASQLACLLFHLCFGSMGSPARGQFVKFTAGSLQVFCASCLSCQIGLQFKDSVLLHAPLAQPGLMECPCGPSHSHHVCEGMQLFVLSCCTVFPCVLPVHCQFRFRFRSSEVKWSFSGPPPKK